MKRIISLLLTVIMIVQMLPLQAFAQELRPQGEETQQITEQLAPELPQTVTDDEAAQPQPSDPAQPEEEITAPPITEIPQPDQQEQAYSTMATGTNVASGTCGAMLSWVLTDDGTLTISGTGAMDDFSQATLPWKEYKDQIKNVVIENGITRIGSWNFAGCESLTGITISDSVTTIESDAFYGCDSLTSVEIPASVTAIGERAFADCASLAEIKVADENSVYCDINGVVYTKDMETLLTYPAGKAETEFVMPESVTTIGNGAFFGCKSLTTIEISDSVKNIESMAFNKCESLTSLIIPEGVTRLKSYLFNGSNSLSTITLPVSVTTIDSYAFDYCESLTTVYYAGSESQWNAISIGTSNDPLTNAQIVYGKQDTPVETVIASGACGTNVNWQLWDSDLDGKGDYLTIAGEGSMTSSPWSEYKSDIKTVVIEDGVTSIGSYAFQNCSSLTSVLIPNSVTKINSGAFASCSSLGSIIIPSSVSSIEGKTFYGCTSLESIKIPDSVTSISSTAFEKCSSLKSIEIPDKVTSIGMYAFDGCSSLVSIKIPDGVTNIARCLFYNCTSLESIDIPDSVTSIGAGAFSGCSSLVSVKIPDGVTSIDSTVFQGCKSLKSLTIPNSVTSIGDWAFNACVSLEKITIPYGVISIDEDAFRSCKSLKLVTIPDSVTTIGNEAFGWCDALSTVCYSGTEDQWNAISIGSLNHGLDDATILFNCCKNGCKWVDATCTQSLHCPVCQTYIGEPLGHDKVEGKEKAPTCTEPGYVDGTVCERCGEIFDVQEIIAALGHTEVTDEAVAPTCTETGLTEGKHCSVCNEVFVAQQIIDALGHTEVECETVEPTCTETGLVGGIVCDVCGEVIVEQDIVDALGHTEVECETVEPTCTETGLVGGIVCDVCGVVIVEQDIVDALGHTEVEAEPVDPTCTEIGLVGGIVCDVCGEVIVEQDIVDALGHTEVIVGAVKATYDSQGYSGDTFCSVCDMLLEVGHVTPKLEKPSATCKYKMLKDKILASNNVDSDGNKYLTEKYTYSNYSAYCNIKYLEAEKQFEFTYLRTYRYRPGEGETATMHIDENGCDYAPVSITFSGSGLYMADAQLPVAEYTRNSSVYFDPILSSSGSMDQSCNTLMKVALLEWELVLLDNFGSSLTLGDLGFVAWEKNLDPNWDENNKTGHTVEKDLAVNPDCTNTGLTEGSSCSVCGKVFVPQKTIAALGHTEVIAKAKAPTCTQEGLTEGSHCSRCNEIFAEQTVIAPLGHSFTNYKFAENGTKVYKCDRCVETRIIGLPKNIICNMGQQLSIPVEFDPYGTTDRENLIWTIEDQSIAVYDEETDLFVIIGYGVTEVTVTDTSNGKTAKTEIIAKLPSTEKLTSVWDREIDKVGLQTGEHRTMQIIGNTLGNLNAKYFDFRSSDESAVTVDENGVITAVFTGSGTSSASATITATAKGDTSKKATLTVKVIPLQTENIEVSAEGESTEEGVVVIDAATVKIAPYSFPVTVLATTMDGVATAPSIKWTTSNSKVAAIKNGVVTIPKDADGIAVITATVNDLKKTTATITIDVRNYAPRMDKTSVTLNSNMVTGTDIVLTQAYSNTVQNLWLEGDDRFFTDYNSATGVVTVHSTEVVKNATYKLTLVTATDRGEYRQAVSVKVANKLPAVTIKQAANFDLFLKDSTADITVTAKDAQITDVTFETSTFTSDYADGVVKVAYANQTNPLEGYVNNKAVTKGNMVISFAGYRDGITVTKSVTVKAKEVKPTLVQSLSATKLTYYNMKGAPITVSVKATKAMLDWSEYTVLRQPAAESYAEIDTDGTLLTISPLLTGENKFIDGKTSATVKLDIQHANWVKPITISHKITVDAKLPTVKAKSATITLNSLFDGTANTLLTSSLNNCPEPVEYRITAVTPNENTAKLDVTADGWTLTAKYKDINDIPANGSYKFDVVPVISTADGNVELAKFTVTVKVAETKPKVSLSKTSVKLNGQIKEDGSVTAKITDGYEIVNIKILNDISNPLRNDVLSVSYDPATKQLTAKVHSKTIDNGNYKYKLIPVVKLADGSTVKTAELAAITFTVTVYNSQPVLKTSAKGSIDTIARHNGIVYTITGGTNIVFNPAEVTEYLIMGTDADKFEISDVSVNAKGQPTVTVRAKADAQLSTKVTYKIQIGARIADVDTEVCTKDISIKPKQSTAKFAVVGSGTMYQSNRYGMATLYITTPAGAKIESVVQRAKGTTVPAGAVSFAIAEIADGVWRIVYAVENPALLKVNSSYKLALAVTPEGNATDKAPQTATVTFKVKR